LRGYRLHCIMILSSWYKAVRTALFIRKEPTSLLLRLLEGRQPEKVLFRFTQQNIVRRRIVH